MLTIYLANSHGQVVCVGGAPGSTTSHVGHDGVPLGKALLEG